MKRLGILIASMMAFFATPVGAMTVPDAPRYFEAGSVSDFQMVPVSDDVLASNVGGFSSTQPNGVAMLDQALSQDLRIRIGIGTEIMDNWWATQGAGLIAGAILR